jgi:uridine kinase
MPLVYVTGISGSGKSAVLQELRQRAHKAVGVDEDGYARWLDRPLRGGTNLPGRE